MGAEKRYSHLLSPIKIRNRIIKNRIIQTNGFPQWLAGPESWPSDTVREYYSRFARNGAAIAIVPPVVVEEDVGKGTPWTPEGKYGDALRRDGPERWDTSNPAVENYFDQIVAAVHANGSLVCEIGMTSNIKGETVEEAVKSAKALEDKGVDVVNMPVEFQDKARVQTLIKRIEAIKNATKLIISMKLDVRGVVPGQRTDDRNMYDAPSLDDAVAMAKMYDGVVDILQFRLAGAVYGHPLAWSQEEGKPNSLIIARAIRDSGSKIYLAPNGGFQDLDENEEFIASGQCDFVTIIRPFFTDFEYVQKAYEGRGEDVVPCAQCNKCHGLHQSKGPWSSVCTANPKLGLEPAMHNITPPAVRKDIAVIGGGPAGMWAAITAMERGHSVTLYEKEGSLGGLLRHADFSPYKWGLRRYKDYLIRQVNKSGVEVLLNTEATPEMIKAKGYDVIVAAVGAEPSIPRIPGADGKNVYNIVNVYPKEKELGKNVVFIGGGEYGLGTGMFLAKAGHRTMVMTSEKELLPIQRHHYEDIIIFVYEHLDDFDFILEAIPTRISEREVIYRDAKGNERSILADSVVLFAGLKPKQDEAMKFYSAARNAFFTIGDCTGECGNVQKAVRNAYFTASQF
jgi:NADPH-dependent 2,4-dienoyl-CoA reductase/sulfur reductase-like enzyme